jgi:hypothetical protein
MTRVGSHLHSKKKKEIEEFGQEVIADKTQYMVMARDQNAGRSNSIKADNIYFESVE